MHGFFQGIVKTLKPRLQTLQLPQLKFFKTQILAHLRCSFIQILHFNLPTKLIVFTCIGYIFFMLQNDEITKQTVEWGEFRPWSHIGTEI